MKKMDKEVAGQRMVDLVGGLLKEHTSGIIESHEKMDSVLSVNIRLSLKHDEGKLNLSTSLGYAKEKVTDHANDILDFDQLSMDLPDPK